MSGLALFAAIPVGIAIGVVLQTKFFNKNPIDPDYCTICHRDRNLPSHEGWIGGMFDEKSVCWNYAALLPEENHFPH